MLLSSKGEIEEANTQAKIALGILNPKIERTRSLYSFLSSDTSLELNNALNEQTDSDGGSCDFVLNLKHSEKNYAARLIAIHSSSVKLHGQYLLILRDMSNEEQLALQRRIFDRVINQNEDILCVIDQHRNVVSHNFQAARSFAGGEKDLSWVDLLERLPERIIELIDELLASGQPQSLARSSHRFTCELLPDLRPKHCAANLFQVVINAKGDIGVGVFISDETEKLALDNELKVALSIYEMSNQAIIITDAKQSITYVNRAFESITGYSAREVAGKNPRLLSSGRHDRTFYTQVWKDIETKGSWSGELWNRRKTGEEYPEWLTISRYPSSGKILNYIATFADITNVKANEKRIYDLAYYDPLTGAGNRRLLKERIEDHVNSTGEALPFCMMFIDLDRFKIINDTLGHETGDELLKLVVRRLSGILRDSDTVYRLGGDEFLLVIYDISGQEAARKAAHINRMLQAPFFIRENEIVTTCSVGIVMHPNDGDSYEKLLKHADIAMYRAKEEGKNRFHFFDRALLEETDRRLMIEQTFRKVIGEQSLNWHYQPQYDLQTGALYGYEALLRTEALLEHNMEEVIQVAEQTGLIHQVSYMALYQALTLLAAPPNDWHSGTRLSVNLSALDFSRAEHFEAIASLIQEYPEQATLLDIEITESIVMDDVDTKTTQLELLKSLGVAIHIDDFGTGFSSLAYLSEYPIDILKIDRRFVSKIGKNHRAESVCKTVIKLAQVLGIQSLAEGVETKAQETFLRDNGCQLVQGFLFGRPEAL